MTVMRIVAVPTRSTVGHRNRAITVVTGSPVDERVSEVTSEEVPEVIHVLREKRFVQAEVLDQLELGLLGELEALRPCQERTGSPGMTRNRKKLNVTTKKSVAIACAIFDST